MQAAMGIPCCSNARCSTSFVPPIPQQEQGPSSVPIRRGCSMSRSTIPAWRSTSILPLTTSDCSAGRPHSDVELEEQDVAVLDDVLFAFHAIDPAFASGSNRSGRNQVVVRNGFSLDEPSLEV